MNFTRLSSREKILGAVTIGCVSVVMIAQFIGSAVHTSFDKIDHEASRLEETLRQSELLLSRRNRIQEEYHQALEMFGDKSGDQDLNTQLLADINTVAKSRKIQLQELNSLPVDVEEGIRTIKIRAAFAGTWTSLLEFVNDLQKSPHRFDVEEAVLEKADTQDHMIRCQMTLTRWSLQEDPS